MKKSLMGALVLMLICTSVAYAQTAPPADQKPAMDCAAMMQNHEEMQKHMADMDTKLNALVDAMNKAKGSAKIDKVAAVVNELVAQHSMMHKDMMAMQPEMMHHMMGHMQAGMAKGMAESMKDCPMMKGEKAPAAHEH